MRAFARYILTLEGCLRDMISSERCSRQGCRSQRLGDGQRPRSLRLINDLTN